MITDITKYIVDWVLAWDDLTGDCLITEDPGVTYKDGLHLAYKDPIKGVLIKTSEEFEYSGIDDRRGNFFYLRHVDAEELTYNPVENRTSSCLKDTQITANLRLVSVVKNLVQVNGNERYEVEEFLRNALLNLDFTDYDGIERNIAIELTLSRVNSIQVLAEERKEDATPRGVELQNVFTAIDFILRFNFNTERKHVTVAPDEGFSTQYQTVYDAFIVKPPADVAEDQDQMVRGMIADGDWQTKDIFYITSAQSAADSLINWINPGTHDLTIVNLLAGNFTAYRGWTGNGVNGYLNTNYNPNTDGVNYLLDSASFGVYVRTDVEELRTDIGIQSAGTVSFLSPRRAIDVMECRINDNVQLISANTDSRGFYVVSRTGANARAVYKNRISMGNDAQVSIAIPNEDVYVLCRNNAGVSVDFSTKQIAAAFAGGGQTQTNVNNFTDRLETFMDSIGAGIIP